MPRAFRVEIFAGLGNRAVVGAPEVVAVVVWHLGAHVESDRRSYARRKVRRRNESNESAARSMIVASQHSAAGE